MIASAPVNLKKALNREFIIIGVCSFVLGSTVLILGYQIKANTDAIRQMRTSAVTKTVQLVTASRLERQYALALPYIPKLQDVLPKRDEMINFDRTLIALAKKQGVGFGFSFGGESPASPTSAGSVNFTITLQGSFADVTNYIDALQKLPYFIEFPGVDMSINGGQYSMRLDGRVFNR